MKFHLFTFAAVVVRCATAQRGQAPACLHTSLCPVPGAPATPSLCNPVIGRCDNMFRETVTVYPSRKYSYITVNVPEPTTISKTDVKVVVEVETAWFGDVGDCWIKTTTTHRRPETIYITQTRKVPTYTYTTTTSTSITTSTYTTQKMQDCFINTAIIRPFGTSGQEASRREDSPNIAETEQAEEPLVDQTDDGDAGFGGFWPFGGSAGEEPQAE